MPLNTIQRNVHSGNVPEASLAFLTYKCHLPANFLLPLPHYEGNGNKI